MRWLGVIVGLFLSLIGLVWILQGISLMPGSVMSGQAFWAVVGLAALVVGLLLLYVGLRRRQISSRV